MDTLDTLHRVKGFPNSAGDMGTQKNTDEIIQTKHLKYDIVSFVFIHSNFNKNLEEDLSLSIIKFHMKCLRSVY